MNIFVNDFGGYAFLVQVSKELAKRGYKVIHSYAENLQMPHGKMNNNAGIDNFKIYPIILKNGFNKYSFFKRIKNEIEYAKKVIEILKQNPSDIFLSANTPLFAQEILLNFCRRKKINFVFWCQDIHSIAIGSFAKKKVGYLGIPISFYFKRKERRQLLKSNHIISISNNFTEIFCSWNIDRKRITTIPNWAPLDEINVRPKINQWSKKMNFDDKIVILYSGTLGLKHNPLLLSNTARLFLEDENVVFVVISEGIGAELLRNEKEKHDIRNLMLLPYQPYEILSEVLGSADVLVSVLEPEAGVFSVPSKVLTYLCAGKATLLSVPHTNLSAQIVQSASAGYVVEPNDYIAFSKKLRELISNKKLREKMGQNARNYAESNFNLTTKCNEFITMFNMLLKKEYENL
jgi:glycosyltransferase involved in cell wall biosynthesis